MTWNIQNAGLMLKKVGGPQGGPGQARPGRAATGSRDVFTAGRFFRLILLRTFLPTPLPCMDVFSGGRGRFSRGRFYRLPLKAVAINVLPLFSFYGIDA
jgi:hypothetical protein